MQKQILPLALLSSVLFPLALPNEFFPMGNPIIGLIALSPLYVAFLRANSPRQASLAGAVFGAVSTFLANYWLMFFGDYSVWTIGGTTLGYVVFNAILGPFLWKSLKSGPYYRPFLFAAVWTVYELLKSVGFLGYPWGLAAYPFNQLLIFAQIVDVVGVWGLSFLAVLLSALAAETVLSFGLSRTPQRMVWRLAVMTGVLILIGGTYGLLSMRRDIPVDGAVDMLLVQQNADSWNTRDIAGPLQTAQVLTSEGLAESDELPDLIVWSETSLRFPYNEYRSWYERNPGDESFVTFLSTLPAPLLTGSPFRTEGGEFTIHNAAILLDEFGNIEQWYGKQQLVPFAEYVPFWESAAVQRFFREVVGIAAIWAPGPGYRVFTVARKSGPDVSIGTPICFEDGFAYITRRFIKNGADIFVNLTNNAWSLRNSAQLQHLVAARFRAIETRRSLVRSTNAGFTGVIDPWGRVTASVPMFTEAHLRVSVPVFQPAPTLYVMWGEYFPLLLLSGLLALLIRSQVIEREQGKTLRTHGEDEPTS